MINKKVILHDLEMKEKSGDDSLEKVRQLIVETKGIEKAETLSKIYKQAKHNIKNLPPTEERDIIKYIGNKLSTKK